MPDLVRVGSLAPVLVHLGRESRSAKAPNLVFQIGYSHYLVVTAATRARFGLHDPHFVTSVEAA